MAAAVVRPLGPLRVRREGRDVPAAIAGIEPNEKIVIAIAMIVVAEVPQFDHERPYGFRAVLSANADGPVTLVELCLSSNGQGKQSRFDYRFTRLGTAQPIVVGGQHGELLGGASAPRGVPNGR